MFSVGYDKSLAIIGSTEGKYFELFVKYERSNERNVLTFLTSDINDANTSIQPPAFSSPYHQLLLNPLMVPKRR